MEAITRTRRLRMSVMRVRISGLLVSIPQRGVRRDDGGLGGEGDAVLGRVLVLKDDVFNAVGAGEGGTRQRVTELVGLGFALLVRHGGPTAAAAGPGVRSVVREHPASAHSLNAASEQRVDHRDIADQDGHEGFANGPAAGLLGAVCTGLLKHELSVW